MLYKLSTIDYRLSIIFIAFILDLIFGDPQWYWHPIRIIGRLIESFQKRLNVVGINRKFAGFVLVVLIVGLTVFSVWIILKLAGLIHPVFYFITCVLLIYFALSIRSLAVEANKVYKALRDGNLLEARKNLSMIVGRDTDRLDEPEIIRATVETVAESVMDGIIAPMFYAFLGGPVLAWGYRAINTLDSMVGYRSQRFIEFGWASAKIDGLMNFIPARLTSILISLSSLFLAKDWLNSIKWQAKYFFKGPQDNSQLTEATMAGALGIQLGGVNFYQGVACKKPLIGDNINPLAIKHIQKAIKITYITSMLMLLSGLGLRKLL